MHPEQALFGHLVDENSPTYTCYVFYRPNEGSGLYGASYLTYTASYSSGRSGSPTWGEVRDDLVAYLLASIPTEVWSPEIGDRESVLRQALEFHYPRTVSNKMLTELMIDGQFGPVRASV